MMFESLESGFGLDVVIWLQAHGGILPDIVSKAVDFAGGGIIYVLMIPLFYLYLDKRLGLRMFVALALSMLLVMTIKYAVQAPRPYHAFPEQVTPLVSEGTYGLPSGHVANAIVMWGMLTIWMQRRWVWIVCGALVVVVAWARMYAGVHYPQDVVVGALIGTLVLGGMRSLERIMPPSQPIAAKNTQ